MIPVNFFKCLSDETRLRCILLLHQAGRLCVCELTEALDLPQPKISRHLAQLRHCGLLTDQREGQWVYYQINDQIPQWTRSILETTIATTRKDERYRIDAERLQSVKEQPGERCDTF